MATPRAWNLWGIEYTLAKFDAGVSPAEIYLYLLANGYSLLELITVERWLRDNGRLADNFSAESRPARRRYVEIRAAPVNVLPSPRAGPKHLTGDLNNDIRCAPANDQLANQQPAISNSPSTSALVAKIHDYLKPWDAQADRLVINAHRAGKSVTLIWFNLEVNGYYVTEDEVVGSLRAQGVTIVDFAPRMGSVESE